MHVKMFETFAGNRADLDEFVLQNSLNLHFTSSRSSNLKNSSKIGHKIYIEYTSARGCLSCVVVLSKPSVLHCLKCNFELALLLLYSKR